MSKVGIYATVASIVLAAVAIALLNLIPSFDNVAGVGKEIIMPKE